ncbi:hypothetical protein ABIB30_001233 [Pedobacter sp. UYP1]|jgi:hypothetical protein
MGMFIVYEHPFFYIYGKVAIPASCWGNIANTQ